MHPNELLHSGEIYDPSESAIMTEQTACLEKQYDFNATRPSEGARRTQLLKEMFAEIGENCYIEPPLHANWGGKHVHFGKNVYAIGGNKKAAIVSGVNAKLTEFMVYVISGFTAACAGVLLSSRIQTGQPAGGQGYELDAITATVIGGSSLSGGRGTVFGCFVGMLVIGIMTNGLDLLNVSSYYQQIIKGAIILMAVLADRKNAL